MKKQGIARLYSFSDAYLIQKGKEKIAFIRRDKAAFEVFGITSAMINAFENAIAVFSETVTDIEALSDQMMITQAKNEKAEALRTAIRNLMVRVQLQFGLKSARYKKFGADALSRQTDAKLFLTARTVVLVGTDYLPELAAHGVTAALLTEITTLGDAFGNLIIEQKISISERNRIQENRVMAGNALYATLVRYTTIGAAIWETTDVAKYNDYVLYTTTSAEVPALALC
jgi:hypothetical protein